MRLLSWSCIVCVLAAACGGTGGGGVGGESSSSGEETGPVRFDVLGQEGSDDSAEAGEMGCRKVDALFAVDNSSSMQEEIDALRGPVFDSFPQTLLDVNNGLDDFQLAVIDACNDPPFFHTHGDGGDCMYSTGKNYMVSSSPDLPGEYACVTDFTTAGYMGNEDNCSGSNDDEQPGNTAADSVSPPAVDGPNAGLMRDDAILFVVAITDEDEQPVPDQTVQEIAQKIVDAKGTIQNVVFLGIGGLDNCDNGAYGSANAATTLQELAQIFVDAQRGLFWDLCQGDLETAFQQAIEIVDSACGEFVPPP